MKRMKKTEKNSSTIQLILILKAWKGYSDCTRTVTPQSNCVSMLMICYKCTQDNTKCSIKTCNSYFFYWLGSMRWEVRHFNSNWCGNYKVCNLILIANFCKRTLQYWSIANLKLKTCLSYNHKTDTCHLLLIIFLLELKMEK